MNFFEQFLTKRVLLGACRMALVALGGWLGARGHVNPDLWGQQVDQAVSAIGGIGSGLAFLYACYTNTRAGLVARTDSLPGVAVVPASGEPSPAAAGNANRP